MSLPATADYSNRQVDVELLQSATATYGLQQLGLTIADTDGRTTRAVAGVQKMLQRYVVALLTGTGTVYRDAAFGTDLIAAVIGSGGRSMGALANALAFANADAVAALQREDADTSYGTLPDDERIARVDVEGVTIPAPGTVAMRVRITSFAGSVFYFVVPISTITR